MKLSRISLLAALSCWTALPAFAAPVAYNEAAAPWNRAQAVRLAPALTPEVLKSFEAERGAAAAAGLAAKQKAVSALLKRYSACELKQDDKGTAAKYFSKEFRAEISYYADGGCASLKAGEAGSRPVARPASLAAVEGAAASLSTREGSAKFFDGSVNGGSAALPEVRAAAPSAAGAVTYSVVPSPKSLSSNVPELRAAAEKSFPVMPADIGKDGKVNQALDYWRQLRQSNWAAYKSGDLQGAEKAKAFLKAAAGAGFGGLLTYSNLGNVEIGAARLRWDIKNGAGKGAITADAARFLFHSMVFVFALAPIPTLTVAKAALGGEAWAIALLAAMGSGTFDHYVTHIADYKSKGVKASA